jgi:hypothetical protein
MWAEARGEARGRGRSEKSEQLARFDTTTVEESCRAGRRLGSVNGGKCGGTRGRSPLTRVYRDQGL